MSYDIGDRVKVLITVKDEDGALVDPDVLTAEVITPDDETTTYTYGTDDELVRESEGVFHIHWDCAASGSHYVRSEATGAVAVAEETGFRVRKTIFHPDT